MFSHPLWLVGVSVHGDNFTATGPKWGLDKYEEAMKGKYELEVKGRLGPDDQDDSEVTVLNRVVRWTTEGIEYEADPRQGELLIRQLGLEGANGVATPGCKYTVAEMEKHSNELDSMTASRFRAAAARANYLSQDRPDIQFAVKEICRDSAHPTELSLMKLKRLGRYLVRHPRLVFKYR